MKNPSHSSFLKLIFLITATLAAGSGLQAWNLAHELGITITASLTWLIILSFLAGLTLISALLLIWLFRSTSKKQVENFKFPQFKFLLIKPLAWLLWFVALIAFSLLIVEPYYGGLIGKQLFMRCLAFWLIGVVGSLALKTARRELSLPAALAFTFLCQAGFHTVFSYLPEISSYPFSLGWSETSRFYYPSLFLSQQIFNSILSLPSLHPSLHILLVPPYLIDAPLWAHRAWQVLIRFLLVGAIAPVLIKRLTIESRFIGWVAGLWIFLFLFNLPLYLHLAVPVLLILYGYSAQNDKRTWLFIVLASVWGGLSRVNWYPMGGVLAALLYLLEVKQDIQKLINYLLKPILFVVVGTGIAIGTNSAYILVSGLSLNNFYTSLSSDLLWARLWPNQTYWLGVLPAIALASLPLWMILFNQMRSGLLAWNTPLGSLLLLGLAGLFAGGILVSMKIGGGADIHNMDAYAVALLIAGGYLFFNQKIKWAWPVTAMLVLSVVWFAQFGGGRFVTYDSIRTEHVLARLQARVDEVNASGGEILFITQRHLVSMGMLKNVQMVSEYEREDLMEMAMANNESYLRRFASELENHRFAAIVVDPLKFNLVGDLEANGPENNAWTRRVAKHILCFYEPAETFAEDRIVIYVPRLGAPQCP